MSGEYLNEHYVTKIAGCTGAPVGANTSRKCPRVFKGAIARVEYEPTMAFGPYCGVDRLDAVIKQLNTVTSMASTPSAQASSLASGWSATKKA